MVRMTRNNGKSSKTSKYRALTRNDLVAFDQEAKQLILRAIDAGCVGRISSKGHCILRGSSDSTASIPRNMTSPNRTAQNARADVKRMLSELERKEVNTSGTSRPSRAPETTTVSQALVDHGSDFTRWFDSHPDGLPADAEIEVTFDARNVPSFTLISPLQESEPEPDQVHDEPAESPAVTRDPVTCDSEPAEPQPSGVSCLLCGRTFVTTTALGAHQRSHRDKTQRITSIRALAEANGVSRHVVRRRLIATGAQTEAGDLEITAETIQRARLTMPTAPVNTTEQTPPDAPTADAENQPAVGAVRAAAPAAQLDPAEVLERVRAALGEDPRVAELTRHNTELERANAELQRQLEEIQTRMALIQEALGA